MLTLETNTNIRERLRKSLLEKRLKLPMEEIRRKSLLIQNKVIMMDIFLTAKRVALYMSFKKEVLTEKVFKECLKRGKTPLFPKVVNPVRNKLPKATVIPLVQISNGVNPVRKSSTLLLNFFSGKKKGDFKLSPWGILEPMNGLKRYRVDKIDVIIVPGLVFDMSGTRLGYGKGYYDNTLKERKRGCKAIALAYDFQVVKNNIPNLAHDSKVDIIVTENRVINIRRD